MMFTIFWGRVVFLSLLITETACAMMSSPRNVEYSIDGDFDLKSGGGLDEFCDKYKYNFVIVVDDTESNRKILSRIVSSSPVVSFSRPNEFLSVAPRIVPKAKLIILDRQMPKVIGDNVMRNLQDEKILRIDDKQTIPPVILNTSDDTLPDSSLLFFTVLLGEAKNNVKRIQAVLKEIESTNQLSTMVEHVTLK